jgi:hypothetical protein
MIRTFSLLAAFALLFCSEAQAISPIMGGGGGTGTNLPDPVTIAHGGTNSTTAGAALTALGGTTAGVNIFTLTNPSAISFVEIAANNTVSTRTPAQVLSDIGAQPTLTLPLSVANGGTGSATGSAASLTAIPAAQVTGANALPDGVLSTNVPLLNATSNTFSNSTNGGMSFTVTNPNGGSLGAAQLFVQADLSSSSIEIGSYSSAHGAYGALVASTPFIYTNRSTGMVLMNDGGPVIVTANGNAETGRFESGAYKGTLQAAGTATSCTGATIGTGSKNNAGFVTSTTTGASTIVITFSVTAPTGWAIMASNLTTANLIRQSAKSTTTATLSGTTVTGDVITYIAVAY